MMELSKRLQAVADLVSAGNRVADIGCDHGYVSIYLIESGKAPHVLAMDVNKGPLERARIHIQEHHLDSYIETRLSNGTEMLVAGEADTLLCAGMGGRLTIRILTEGKEKIAHMKELILQPQSEIHLVRGYLPTIGYEIVDEDMVYEDGKFYPIMKAVRRECDFLEKESLGFYSHILERSVPGESSLNEYNHQGIMELCELYGGLLIQKKHEVLQSYLEYEANKTNKLILDLTNANNQTEKQLKRRKELEKELLRIKKVQSLI